MERMTTATDSETRRAVTEKGETTPDDPSDRIRSAAYIALFFCLGVFINGFTNLPLSFELKEGLKLDPLRISWFAAISDTAWYIKPAFGLLSDRVTLFGQRRKPYLCIMGGLLVMAWWVLAASGRFSYGELLGAMAVNALALAFMNTVTAGLLAELSRADHSSGRLNSLRQIASQTALVVAGPAGGWAASHWPFQRVAAVAAGAAMVLLVGSQWLVREPRLPYEPLRPGQTEAAPVLRRIVGNRAVWLALLFIMLVELSPGFNTPLVFFQRDVLKFPKEWFGALQMGGALAALVAAAGYAMLCRSRPLIAILPVVLGAHAVATLSWLALHDPGSALAIKVVTGFTLALTNLAIFDLATRAAPPGAEGTVLAAIFAGVNIAGKLSDLIGSKLYNDHWSLPSLVLLNAGTTLLTVFLVPYLPRSVVCRRDGEMPPGCQK
jgi:predicted MFS family arabinose efflux permease